MKNGKIIDFIMEHLSLIAGIDHTGVKKFGFLYLIILLIHTFTYSQVNDENNEVKVGEFIDNKAILTYPENLLISAFTEEYNLKGYKEVRVDSIKIKNVHSNYYLASFAKTFDDGLETTNFYVILHTIKNDLYLFQSDKDITVCQAAKCTKCIFDIDRCFCIGDGDQCNHNTEKRAEIKGLENLYK